MYDYETQLQYLKIERERALREVARRAQLDWADTARALPTVLERLRGLFARRHTAVTLPASPAPTHGEHGLPRMGDPIARI